MALINFNYFGSGGTHAGVESKTKRFKVAEDPEIKRATKKNLCPTLLGWSTKSGSNKLKREQELRWLALSKRGVR